ncbi:MAG: glutamate-5-semialdehyde dehydrogenase [Eubacteriales bacterium]|nr:glutamate-5-semialdehyde dehydrogenase [Eubacteriales bacterium]
MADIRSTAQKCAAASVKLAALPSDVKNAALSAVKKALLKEKDRLFAANGLDLAAAAELPAPVRKRLRFDEAKLNDCLNGLDSLIALPDPVGNTLMATELDKGLDLYKVSCPIGVIGIIFESRPDALVQISLLCLKSGNAALLKGGSEAAHTNQALYDVITRAASPYLPEGWLALLHTRDDVAEMLSLNDCIDLIIPRGSNAFVRYIMDHTSIHVLGHADGICHCYVDADADIAEAVRVVIDAKAQYVSVCNAAETLLVHEAIAPAFLPVFAEAAEKAGVTLIGDEATREIIDALPAAEEDWKTEYLDYKLAVRIVPSLTDAIAHINRYGSGHTDSILTRSGSAASRFTQEVDSANVFVNCSTRFSDGFRYGFGAEVGISTNKIHARGPVGLDGLVIYKYKLIGHGQIVAPYTSGEKRFTHRKLDGDCPL